MRYIPFDLLSEIPGKEDRFWSLICSDNQFYKLTKAYNTLNQNLCEAERSRECELTFQLDDLRKERLWIKDEIFHRLGP